MRDYRKAFRTSTDGIALGDHIVNEQAVHGIYAGNCEVVGIVNGMIANQSLEQFAGSGGFQVLPDKSDFAAAEIVRRAKSQLTRPIFPHAQDSDKHFCHWCRHGLTAVSEPQ
ncbi:MAG: lecithin retinol acyltransferase family protein [Negativicutes bacterium]|nr:lecithin retinol acyltransferase family protein [Negativicutes bacterium]